jgi:hypothetical protein
MWMALTARGRLALVRTIVTGIYRKETLMSDVARGILKKLLRNGSGGPIDFVWVDARLTDATPEEQSLIFELWNELKVELEGGTDG